MGMLLHRHRVKGEIKKPVPEKKVETPVKEVEIKKRKREA